MPVLVRTKSRVGDSTEFFKCTKCDEIKHKSEFYKENKKSSGKGIRSECKVCTRVAVSRPDNAEKRVAALKQSRYADPIRFMLYAAKYRAKKGQYPFTITANDICIPKLCPVLGMPLQFNKGLVKDNSPSLDKFIPTKGYVPGNVSVISWRANALKTDATTEDIKAIVVYLKKFKQDSTIGEVFPKVMLESKQEPNSPIADNQQDANIGCNT